MSDVVPVIGWFAREFCVRIFVRDGRLWVGVSSAGGNSEFETHLVGFSGMKLVVLTGDGGRDVRVQFEETT